MAKDGLLAGLLAEYARSVGLGRVATDADGLAALSFDDRLVVHLAPGEEPDTAVLYARVGAAVPEGRRAAAHRLMLEANLLGDTLGGGALALDERDGGPVLVHRTRLSGMDGAEFGRLVERFVDAAEAWTEGLAAGAGAGAGTDDPAGLPWPAGPGLLRA